MEYCEYGCNKLANFKLKNGKNCCSSFSNKCEAVRAKNSKGLVNAHKNGLVPSFTKEQQKKSRNNFLINWDKVPFEQRGRLKKKSILFAEQEGKCLWCKLDSWLGKPIQLELDHIDGNKQNELKSNLRLLCPNCHSQTDTYKSKNKNKQMLS